MSEAPKTGTVLDPGTDDLPSLADKIRKGHEAFKLEIISGCQKAIAIGELLLRAKELVQQDGKWTEWLPANTNIDERQAQRYMQIALNKGKLLAKGDLKSLTMTGAIKLIEQAKNPEEPTGSGRNGAGSKGNRKSAIDKAIERDPVNLIKKAWDKCNTSQQGEVRQIVDPT